MKNGHAQPHAKVLLVDEKRVKVKAPDENALLAVGTLPDDAVGTVPSIVDRAMRGPAAVTRAIQTAAAASTLTPERVTALEAISVPLVQLVGANDVESEARARAALKAALEVPSTSAAGLVLGVKPITASEIADPLPPIEWVSRDLQWCPGRPGFLVGYSGSCKSLAMISAGVAVAAGLPIWGQFHTQRRRVRYLVTDSGRRAAMGRIQRIAFGIGVDLHELEGWLELVPHPRVLLTDPTAPAAYRAAADGCGLVLMDALRGFLPGVDENSSEVREYLDPLIEVSDAAGAAFVIVHHEGKSGGLPGGRKEKPDDEAMRGSAGLQDAAGSVLRVMKDDAPGTFMVRMSKDAEEPPGPRAEPFYLQIGDVDHEGRLRAGVQVLYRTREQVYPPTRPEDVAERAASDLDADALAILRFAAALHAKEQTVAGVDGAKGAKGADGKGMGHAH